MLRSLSEGASKYRQVQALSTSVHRQGRLVRERAAHRGRLAETRLCCVAAYRGRWIGLLHQARLQQGMDAAGGPLLSVSPVAGN